ncbi:sulfatase-like hydrolase/transferase [bacterium]|nr:sulfatase-like hydrolase/transferase [bacterium]
MRALFRVSLGFLGLGVLATVALTYVSSGRLLLNGTSDRLIWAQEPTQSLQPRPSATAVKPTDVSPVHETQQPRPTRGLVEALREQVRTSQILDEAGVQQDLMDSLDQAHELWSRTKAQNREALRRLQRGPSVGIARQAPHIVLITVDEWGDASPTDAFDLPHWSDWASQGLVFSQHYAGGSDTESGFWSLMTGQNTGHATHPVNQPRTLRASDRHTLSHLLWKAGYDTAMIGPWTSPVSPLDSGWDHWSGLWQMPDKSPKSCPQYPQHWGSGDGSMTISDNTNGQSTVSIWELQSTDAAALLKRQPQRTRPLFLHMRLPRCPELSSAAQGEAWDGAISTVLSQITEQGLQQQTCVVVTALTGRSPAADVAPLSEENLRVPLLIQWPGHTSPGTVNTSVTAAWDLLPTLKAIGVASAPEVVSDGRLLLPLFDGKARTSADLLYWKTSNRPVAQAVRSGPWKARYNPENQQLLLFDLEHDPQEHSNVAAEHPDILAKLLKGPADAVQQALKSSAAAGQP